MSIQIMRMTSTTTRTMKKTGILIPRPIDRLYTFGTEEKLKCKDGVC